MSQINLKANNTQKYIMIGNHTMKVISLWSDSVRTIIDLLRSKNNIKENQWIININEKTVLTSIITNKMIHITQIHIQNKNNHIKDLEVGKKKAIMRKTKFNNKSTKRKRWVKMISRL